MPVGCGHENTHRRLVLREVDDGNLAAESAAGAIEEVVEGIKNTRTSNRLSETLNEQAKAMDQAEAGVNQISEVVQSNSAGAQESSATSRSFQLRQLHSAILSED